ncbi:MAG: hypothetical protein L3J26_09535 [Candidatus Polarisedimenticolaceae bacterium]|nr:hypothetical protein [Candidatus Polarisedimenticolaceae bacterium]
MEIDFSSLNLQYLLQARDIAKKQPELASAVLGLPLDLIDVLAHTSGESLAEIAKIKAPLLMARGQPLWWARLFKALKEGNQDEINAVLEHASLAIMVQPE